MTESAGTATGTLSFGPFTVTSHERLVMRDGVALPLGAKAFDTLIALMSRPNEVVSKCDLMALVWPGLTVEEANLRFHVAALRKALGDGKDGARYITTLSGRGYCFVAPISQRGNPAERAPAARTEFPPVKLPNRLQRMVGRDDAVAAVSDSSSPRASSRSSARAASAKPPLRLRSRTTCSRLSPTPRISSTLPRSAIPIS